MLPSFPLPPCFHFSRCYGHRKRRETVKWARKGGLHHGIAGEEELGHDMQADKWFCDKL